MEHGGFEGAERLMRYAGTGARTVDGGEEWSVHSVVLERCVGVR